MGLFDRFKAALKKTGEKVSAGLSFLGIRRAIDDGVIAELERTMLTSDLGPATTRQLIEEVRSAWKARTISETTEIIPFLQTHLISLWPPESRALAFARSGPTVILVAGINGSGKTTSVAKLARRLQKDGKKVILGACDTFRAAAIEQLSIWAERCNVPIVRHKDGADPGAVAYETCDAAVARGMDVALIDTAGRLHTQDNLMRELGKIQRVTAKRIPGAPHEALLVLDATIGQNALLQAEHFKTQLPLTGIVLAKLDGSARGGVVAAIREKLGLPVKFVGVGEGLDDLEPFEPAAFVEALFASFAAADAAALK